MNFLRQVCLRALLSLPVVLSSTRASEQLQSDQFARVASVARKQAEKFGGPNHVLVAFDIDNTLLASPHPLGSDQWFMWQASLLESAPESKYLVAENIGDLVEKQGRLLTHHRMRLTQPSVPMTMGGLAESRFPLLILTARGPTSFDLTRKSLETAGVSIGTSALSLKKQLAEEFKPEALADLNQEFSEDERLKFRLTHTSAVRYSQGILLSAGQNKGAMLRLLLRGSRHEIKAVVFIDDLERNTTAVFDALKGTEFDVTTIRFSGEDTNIQGFLKGDKQRVHREWRQFRRLEAALFD